MIAPCATHVLLRELHVVAPDTAQLKHSSLTLKRISRHFRELQAACLHVWRSIVYRESAAHPRVELIGRANWFIITVCDYVALDEYAGKPRARHMPDHSGARLAACRIFQRRFFENGPMVRPEFHFDVTKNACLE